MKRITLGMLPLAMMGSVLLTGCVETHRPAVVATTQEPLTQTTTTRRVVVVTEAPPAPQTEVVGVPPSESQVWIQGYWMRTNNRWVWMPGHWEMRPRPAAIWVPGHWDKNPEGKGFIWVEGYWQ